MRKTLSKKYCYCGNVFLTVYLLSRRTNFVLQIWKEVIVSQSKPKFKIYVFNKYHRVIQNKTKILRKMIE